MDDSPAGLAAMVRHEVEPSVEIALEPVDSVVVTIVMDNVTDATLADQGPAHRIAMGGGPRRAAALMLGDQVPDALIAEHGFSALITVTKVELNVDLSVANVYVSIIGDDATADAALAGLAKPAGFLRGPTGRKLNLQHAPELRFIADASVDMSEKLAAIIRDDEDRARAAGRDPRAPAPPPVAPTASVPVEQPDKEPA